MKQSLNILLISPDTSVREFLENSGHHLTVVQDSDQILESARQEEIDLLIADLSVNGLPVFPLFQQIKQNNPATKLIILTPKATLNSALQAMRNGALGYLIKPYEWQDLKRLVDRVREDHQTAAPSKETDTVFDLLEIVNILFQVNNLELAAEMILDTCSEFFGIETSAVALPAGEKEYFQIYKSRNLPQSFEEKFVFSGQQTINGKAISTQELTVFTLDDFQAAGYELPEKTKLNAENVYLFPLVFHENLVGYVIIFTNAGQVDNRLPLLKIFTRQIAPVIFSFETSKKGGNSYESIIGKIIKDRVHEARMLLNPVSFAVFRIVYLDQLVDSLLLEDAMKSFQMIFRDKIGDQGDLIWLTADTIFTIFPLKDLFLAESLATEIKEAISMIRLHDPEKQVFDVNYACISYPQSGESATEIIHNLWLKLFEEIYFMKS